jgi:dipeptidyl aminopeptidase/acylaminoacyl peptidase
MNNRAENYPALNFSDELATAVSPILYVNAGDPPTLLIHGTDDTVVLPLSSEMLASELKQAGVVYKHLVIEGGTHSFPDPAHAAEAAQATVGWFMQYL